MFTSVRRAVRLAMAIAGLIILGAWHSAQAQSLPSAAELQRLAPAASLATLALALTAYHCASQGEGTTC